VEVVLTVGPVAYFVLLYAVFVKLFPIIAVWEYKEGLRPVSGSLPRHAESAPAGGD
jgi:hypothetical protein